MYYFILFDQYVTIFFIVSPLVTIQAISYVVIEGNAVTLGCTVYPRLPENIVFWKRSIIDRHLENSTVTIPSIISFNYANITSPHSGSTATIPSLTILNATIDDIGFYRCYASNSVGTGESSATFLIV